MRAIFGIVGVLVTVGVIVWFMGGPGGTDYVGTVLQANKQAKSQASQIAGVDVETGEHANQSAKFEPLTIGGKLNSLLVEELVPGGAYERYFGLKRHDAILAVEYVEYQANRMNVRDFGSDDDAKAHVEEAFRRKGHVYVMRDEKEVKLPAAGPTAAAPGKKNATDPLQQQLDTLQNIPGAGR
jgi:hypothetical protein